MLSSTFREDGYLSLSLSFSLSLSPSLWKSFSFYKWNIFWQCLTFVVKHFSWLFILPMLTFLGVSLSVENQWFENPGKILLCSHRSITFAFSVGSISKTLRPLRVFRKFWSLQIKPLCSWMEIRSKNACQLFSTTNFFLSLLGIKTTLCVRWLLYLWWCHRSTAPMKTFQ